MSAASEMVEALGPEQIRTAFTAAAAAADAQAGDLTGIADILAAAADRYESLGMAETTVAHLLEGAASMSAATASLTAVGEIMRGALADFDGRDGLVADAVRDTGNLMDVDGPPSRPTGQAPARASVKDHAVTSPARPVPDPLKAAGRFALREGETFAGSGAVKDADGTLALIAAVDTPAGRQVHLAVPIYAEDRKRWRGAHAGARESVVDDEDGEEYSVDTGADLTVLLDAPDAACLPEIAARVIAEATAASKQYRQLSADYDRLYAARAALEAQRFPHAAQEKIRLDRQERHTARIQDHRRRFLDECAGRLSPQARAVYDDLQARIDAAGRHGWEPDRHAQAAAVCGLSDEEFQQLQQLQRTPWRSRTREQQQRLDQLAGSPPALLQQQAALICGLRIEEFQQMHALERRASRRDLHEQQRLEELKAASGGATAGDARRTRQMRGQYLIYQEAHHNTKTALARLREDVAQMEASARLLDAHAAANLHRITAALDAVSDRQDEMNGGVTASAAIPARNGGALIIDAIQEEEGGVRYCVARKPAGADDDWSPGDHGEPFISPAAGLRKLTNVIAGLAVPGDRA